MPSKSQDRKSNTSLFAKLESLIKNSSISEDLPTKYLPHILFIFLLGIFYVANNHLHSKLLREVSKLETIMNEYRVAHMTLKANFMYKSKQSEVAKNASEVGLEESKTPPFILEKGGLKNG